MESPLLAALAIGFLVVLVWWIRRAQRPLAPSVTFTVTTPASARRGRSAPASLTLASAVVPVPSPPGWPPLPPLPPGLDGQPESRPYVEVADREYDRTTCPHCTIELDPLPKAKKRCPSCTREIFVRSGPDNRRYLLTSDELAGWDQRWVEHYEVRHAEALQAQERAELEWRQRLLAVGVADGEGELDVVGESYYHATLAGIRAALGQSGYEAHAIAALVAEPNNPHDRNAVGVFIHGQKVGHLDRYDAEEYQPALRRVGGQIYVEAVIMGGRPTPQGEVGPIGVRLLNVPEV